MYILYFNIFCIFIKITSPNPKGANHSAKLGINPLIDPKNREADKKTNI